MEGSGITQNEDSVVRSKNFFTYLPGEKEGRCVAEICDSAPATRDDVGELCLKRISAIVASDDVDSNGQDRSWIGNGNEGLQRNGGQRGKQSASNSRRFSELGVSGDELPEVKPVETAARDMTARELEAAEDLDDQKNHESN